MNIEPRFVMCHNSRKCNLEFLRLFEGFHCVINGEDRNLVKRKINDECTSLVQN